MSLLNLIYRITCYTGVIILIVSARAFSSTLPDNNPAISDTCKVQPRKERTPGEPARYLQVNDVIIAGNKITRGPIILRELLVKPGTVIRDTDLEYVLKKDEQKLFNLHLFNTVSLRVVPLDSVKINIHVDVEERWYTFVMPRFQLSDRNFNEWWQNYNHDLNRVNYGVKLYQYNILGLNHTLLLKAQFGFQRDFQMTYKIPYFNKKQKEGLILDLDYIDGKSVPDSTIQHKLNFIKSNNILRTTTGLGLTYTYRENFYLQHRLKYEYRRSTIADTLRQLNENYLGHGLTRQVYDAITYELRYDRLDVAAYPLQGLEFLFGVQRSGIVLRSNLEKTSAYVRFSSYLPLKNNLYLSNLSVLYWSGPDQIPYYNYSTMGYDKIFVRGYEVYVIEGPYFVLNKTTLKKRIFSRNWHMTNWSHKQFNYLPLSVYIKTYADFGFVDNYDAYETVGDNRMFSEKLLSGAGFGIDVVTGYDMAVRFEYTFTPQTNGFFLHFKKEF